MRLMRREIDTAVRRVADRKRAECKADCDGKVKPQRCRQFLFFSNATVIIAHMLLLWHHTCRGAMWLVSKWVDFVVSKLHKEEKQLYPSVTRVVLAAVWLLLVIENYQKQLGFFVIKIIIREVNFFANWRSTPYCASCYSPSPSCWGATPSSCFLLPWYLKGSWICKCNPWMSWTLLVYFGLPGLIEISVNQLLCKIKAYPE